MRNIYRFLNVKIADLLSNKKLNPIVTAPFIGVRKPNISLVLITPHLATIFPYQKNRLNSTYYLL